MINTKNKILVLTDLSDQSINVVKSASKIAQLIDGDIELFHVRKPTKVVEKESSLSAVRVFKDHYVDIEKKLTALSDSLSEDVSTQVSYSFEFGNLKNEISNHIEKTKPDIIVLGKRGSKTPAFFGDNMFSVVLKKFSGPVLLATNDTNLEDSAQLSLGLYNNANFESNVPFINSIVSGTDRPIRSFSVESDFSNSEAQKQSLNFDVIPYVFENNDATLKNMSNYIDKDKVNLLLVNRKSNTTKKDLSISALNDLAYSIKVPLLFSN